ncbi:unnamed protein product [Adineta ricciae]|uniref:Uncharacterized protein n=1 Tax=Adineta ricciae TaxID=249248 RepID=A0A815VWT5_ADIRI|nr:unnamed protein product [Adineta ricciae]CAF1533435.1 unnamed protein product [Adineta ricciae]
MNIDQKITQNLTSLFVNNSDCAEAQVYVLAVGTIKRDSEGASTSMQSQTVHKRILDKIIEIVDGVEYLRILREHHIKHEVLLHDAFSRTQEWGSIHTFYVKVIGSHTVAYGAAALLGQILQQYAIGIYHPITDEDRRMLNSMEDEKLSETLHQYFVVHLDSVLSDDKILAINKRVCERFPQLSGQLDFLGQSIEFHDFHSSFKGTGAQIEEILRGNFQEIFQVKRQLSKSTVLTKYDYQEAINALSAS